jgi:hypothetical protein
VRGSSCALLLALAACSPLRSIDRRTSLGRPDLRADVDDVPVHGEWVRVSSGGRAWVGELLAVDPERLWLVRRAGLVWFRRTELSRVTILVSDAPEIDVSPAGWDLLYQFARFPQGLPPAWRRIS